MDVLRCLPLLAALALVGCSDPSKELARVVDVRDAGDDAATEAALRHALERHPEDLELLLVAADFYLGPQSDDYYRPRLALHYAMRADQAANYQDPRATRAMLMAHRGAGGFAEADAMVRDGLASVGHPDAADPVRLEPVDRDLLEPTLPNFVEQRRRQTDGRPEPTCEPGMLLVPAGEYGPDLEVQAYCVEERGRPVQVECDAMGLRACQASEAQVAAGPVAGLLLGAATDVRCCADPVIQRVLRDPSGAPIEADEGARTGP